MESQYSIKKNLIVLALNNGKVQFGHRKYKKSNCVKEIVFVWVNFNKGEGCKLSQTRIKLVEFRLHFKEIEINLPLKKIETSKNLF